MTYRGERMDVVIREGAPEVCRERVSTLVGGAKPRVRVRSRRTVVTPTYCPVWWSPSLEEISQARRRHDRWCAAMRDLLVKLQGTRLVKFDVTGFVHGFVADQTFSLDVAA